jgi:hypothetical protein
MKEENSRIKVKIRKICLRIWECTFDVMMVKGKLLRIFLIMAIMVLLRKKIIGVPSKKSQWKYKINGAKNVLLNSAYRPR